MFEYSKKNHFKFGYKETGWFKNRSSPTETFVCEYGHTNTLMSFREANIYAAKYIANIADNDISLMFSGGADSEIAAWALIDAGIPFRAAIMRFKNGLNEHDICYAINFCRYHNIGIDFYDLDVEKFLYSSEFERIVRKYHANTEVACALWLADQIPNFAILGQGEPVLTKMFGQWYFREKEQIVSWNKFWIYNNRPGIPGFHQFSPEQILSCLTDSLTQELVSSKREIWSNEYIKHSFYKKHYPEFKLREKYTGYERIVQLKMDWRARVLATHPYSIAAWYMPYNEFTSSLIETDDK